MEVEILNRFTLLWAEAEDQALHLTYNRELFILREIRSQQPYAEATTLDLVEAAIHQRRREIEAHARKRREEEYGRYWVDYAARIRERERREQEAQTGRSRMSLRERPVWRCVAKGCSREVKDQWTLLCWEHAFPKR